jgi:hypothetical protein
MINNSAVKIGDNGSYVEIPNNETVDAQISSAGIVLQNTPITKDVQIGLANDTMTEIVSGLNEGDVVIIRKVSASSNTTTAGSGKSIMQAAGGMGMPGR